VTLATHQRITARPPGSPLPYRYVVLGLSDDGLYVAVRKAHERDGDIHEYAVASLRDLRVEPPETVRQLGPGNLTRPFVPPVGVPQHPGRAEERKHWSETDRD
jgi:hypothetical protein